MELQLQVDCTHLLNCNLSPSYTSYWLTLSSKLFLSSTAPIDNQCNLVPVEFPMKDH